MLTYSVHEIVSIAQRLLEFLVYKRQGQYPFGFWRFHLVM
jgi:hypothetical protein